MVKRIFLFILGIIIIGLFILTNLVSGFNGDAPFIATFPAKARGLSYQVLIIGPPYISVLSLTYFPSEII